MKKMTLVLMGLAVGLLMVSAACGGGGGKAKPTATALAPAETATAPEATATEAGTASTTPPSAAELKADLADIKAVLQDTIAKAQAGDVQGTRDAEAKGDTSMEAIIRAVRLVDPTLADAIETKELAYEAQADSANTDLIALATDAQDALALLDQAAAALQISP